jgi:predicted ATPase/signal transduction histidine kinase
MSTVADNYDVTSASQGAEGFVIYHAIRRHDRHPVLLRALGQRPLQPRALKQLENELEMAEKLGAPALTPIALEYFDGTPALVLEDFSGEALSRRVGRPFAPAEFLRIAIAVAEALAELHHRDVVHKNIKPENILIDNITGEVRITDFGVASLVPREQQQPGNPALMEGTLAFMAPEQTGRMNRPVDQRSDLYSLGVTFWQMLTGALPFAARDPLEWVHCHIARLPQPPAELVPTLPEMLSRIVMKLLAKAAEDRYQSATGLRADLKECLARLRASGTIELFPLAQHDVLDRPQLPHKLVGREQEIGALHDAFKRVLASGTSELILLSGYAGVGKSALAQQLRGPTIEAHGCFLSGKFDQYKRNIPYAPLVEAFQNQVLDILSESDERIAAWRERLQAAVGVNGRLVVDVIPQLELIIGEQPLVVELPLTEAQLRFSLVLQRFVHAFATRDHPVVLFLDDLQWADSASLKLIEQLATNPEMRFLLLIGTYRDNEVRPAHPLAQAISEARNRGAIVREIVLAPLSPEQLCLLIADMFRSSAAPMASLAALLHKKTGGNPFFAIQFLTLLCQERLIELDRQSSAWRWDVAKIADKGFTDNVVELMVTKVKRLPVATQRVLELAACLGNRVEASLVAMLCDRTVAQVDRDLAAAAREDLVSRCAEAYRFAHDRVQQAAYLLIPDDERPAIHLRIARILRAQTPPEAIEVNVFDIVNQLNRATLLVTDEKEKLDIVGLNLIAARKAKAANAYAAAIGHLEMSANLLGPAAWEQHYALAHAVELQRAENEHLSGHLEDANRRLALLLERSRTTLDRATVLRLKDLVHLARGEILESIETERQRLALFGVVIPPHPSWADAVAERERVQRLLGDRSIEALIDLPRMIDPEKEAALQTEASGYFVDSNQYFLCVARLVALSLEHGNADASAVWYGYYAICLAGFFYDYGNSYRFAKLAYDLIEKRGLTRYRTRAHFYLAWASFWKRPIDEVLAHAKEGFTAAVEVGELVTAAYLSAHIPLWLLSKGAPLSEVVAQQAGYCDFVRQTRFQDMVDVHRVVEHFVKTLQGKTTLPFEEDFSQRVRVLPCIHWILRLRSSFLFGDYRQAIESAERAQPLLFAVAGICPLVDYHVYHALTLAAVFDTSPAPEQAQLLTTLRAHEHRLAEWSNSHPSGFSHHHTLLAAEIARITGHDLEAQQLYEKSLQQARAGGFTHDEALAYEVAARFYQVRGLDTFADVDFSRAHACYLRWGAEGKAAQLEKLHPHLAVDDSRFTPGATLEARPELIDLLSVMKASRAISREMRMDVLLRSLMEIVLEQSGAQRACLLLPRAEELVIEAEATFGARAAQVSLLQGAPASAQRVPISIVHYVWRTGERVIFEDVASAVENRFAKDPYLAQEKPRSLLCLPILKRGHVVGVLVLDNNALPGVFTRERLTVLELLAAQAAISLENARYVEQERAARAAAEQAEQRAAFLADAGQLLAESLEAEIVLGRLAKLAVRTLADWCSIDIDADGEIQRLAVAHRNSDKEAVLHDLQRRHPPHWGSPHPAARVMKTGQSLLMPDISEDELRSGCEDEDHVELIRALGTRTGLVVPLSARGRVFGTISLGSSQPGRRFGKADLEIAEELARRAASAIDNAQLYWKSQEALQVRNEFLSIASHELNTPLVGLMLNLQAMLAPPEGKPLSAERMLVMAKLAEAQAQRLKQLISELLDVTRIERKQLSLNLKEVDLTRLVQQVAAGFDQQLARAKCTLSLVADGPVVGCWDDLRVEQVVSNLLGNATKFGAGKPIEIRVDRAGACARVSVTDHGIGIDPRRQARIFNCFERGVSAQHYGGLGLGLYVCRSIVEAHGGSIAVESELGRGSTFTVELPCGEVMT